MASPVEPEHPRRLGRSRVYTREDLPHRLTHWHSPRINRWERLNVTGGTLIIELRDASGARLVQLEVGASPWIAPGVRWRVADIWPDTRFEFEVHVDTLGQAQAPQTLRSRLLDEARCVTVADAKALHELLGALVAGERRVINARFPFANAVSLIVDNHRLFWHPLCMDAEGFTALAARSDQPFGLAEYLGRDHAVIEAALAGALRGDEKYKRWLVATLERHLHIEEELLFPAYLESGGREAWVRGMKNEHAYLRDYLGQLQEAGWRRKFLRLLDGHDEKEERVVYPDILDHLGEQAKAVLMKSKAFPIPGNL